jgi:hypothetical protein
MSEGPARFHKKKTQPGGNPARAGISGLKRRRGSCSHAAHERTLHSPAEVRAITAGASKRAAGQISAHLPQGVSSKKPNTPIGVIGAQFSCVPSGRADFSMQIDA